MADGLADEAPALRLTGPTELTDALRAQLIVGSNHPQQHATVVVRAGAFAVTVDAHKWLELSRAWISMSVCLRGMRYSMSTATISSSGRPICMRSGLRLRLKGSKAVRS